MPKNKLFLNVNLEDPSLFRNNSLPSSNENQVGIYHPQNEFMRGTRDLSHVNKLKDHEYIYMDTNDISWLLSMNVNTFYKIRWNSKCSKEIDILHFYEVDMQGF